MAVLKIVPKLYQEKIPEKLKEESQIFYNWMSEQFKKYSEENKKQAERDKEEEEKT